MAVNLIGEKIVQINNDGEDGSLFALTNHGRIFVASWVSFGAKIQHEWKELELPKCLITEMKVMKKGEFSK